MKNISLYIAKRYNTYTLLISLVIIALSALSIGTLTYIGNSALIIFQQLLFPNQVLNNLQIAFIYSLSFAYVIGQISIIHLIFNRLLRKINNKIRLRIQLSMGVFMTLISFILIFSFPVPNLWIKFLVLIFISTGLLSIFMGLISYLFTRSKITGVNIITSIAVFAITIGTTALFIILSVFSGLEKMNLQFLNNVNPDLKISPTQGKVLPEINNVLNILENTNEIKAFSKIIEEKVSIEFDDKQDIAYIKGVDEHYRDVVKIDTAIVYGSYFDFKLPYEILASDGVARRLQLYLDNQHPSRLRMPKPGVGLITTEEEAFNSVVANPIGVFIISEQYDKYIFSPLELTQILLELPENSAYGIEIKLNNNASANQIKNKLQSELGNQYLVQTRQDIDATFLKVMNVENLIIYLIFTLVIIIASFNLAGAIIIIIIDKKNQIKTMWSFGMTRSSIKRIFFQTGMLITVFSVAFGLFLGSTIGILQNQFRLVMANPYVPFPFEFTAFNYLIVTLTVLLIGGIVSWMVSRKLPI